MLAGWEMALRKDDCVTGLVPLGPVPPLPELEWLEAFKLFLELIFLKDPREIETKPSLSTCPAAEAFAREEARRKLE